MIRELKFKILCQKHADSVYRFSRSILGNAEDAEDATQEILLKLWRNVSDVSTMHAGGWVMTTTRNHCLNMLRRRSKVAGVLSAGNGNLDEVVPSGNPGPESDLFGVELRSRIDDALNQLPEAQRSVFVLYEVNGMKYREISECLNIPVNTVKVYLLRSRSRLKEILAAEVHYEG
ncbi:MAG: sigma-70 family RNA polymerase sigma factor [Acidobacteriota bacterium]|jgi:RNA polymerase sigma factor (sigma-70 family)